MIAIGANGTDILDPAIVAIVEIDARLNRAAAAGVVHCQVLNANPFNLSRPPYSRPLSRPPVVRKQWIGDGDGVAADCGYFDYLGLIAVYSPNRSAVVGTRFTALMAVGSIANE